jgi:CSLREA domain-containing protein
MVNTTIRYHTDYFSVFKGGLIMNTQPSQKRHGMAHRLSLISTLLNLVIVAGCTYTVNTQIDAPDANPGDFVCQRTLRSGESMEAAEAEGLCSLRAAIMEANATSVEDRIIVPAGNYNLTLPIAVGGGRLIVSNSVRIQGAGKTSTIITQAVGDRVFSITNGDVAINHVTIQGGESQSGGGIRIDAATVRMVDVTIRENFGFTGGGGILITADGEMRIYRAAVEDNNATGAFGGGIWNQGVLWVYESTISNNQSNRAGGIRNSGNMNLRNTTVSGNVATSPEAGVAASPRLNLPYSTMLPLPTIPASATIPVRLEAAASRPAKVPPPS